MKIDSSWADPSTDYPLSFKWNDLDIFREWDGSPADTVVNWYVVLNGDTLINYSETDPDSMVFSQEGMIIRTNCAFVYIDNVFIRSLTPGSNHDSTHYCLQDSASTNYIDWTANPDTIKSSSEIWGTYYEWNTLTDTLSQLNPNTTYYIRLKARSGRN